MSTSLPSCRNHSICSSKASICFFISIGGMSARLILFMPLIPSGSLSHISMSSILRLYDMEASIFFLAFFGSNDFPPFPPHHWNVFNMSLDKAVASSILSMLSNALLRRQVDMAARSCFICFFFSGVLICGISCIRILLPNFFQSDNVLFTSLIDFGLRMNVITSSSSTLLVNSRKTSFSRNIICLSTGVHLLSSKSLIFSQRANATVNSFPSNNTNSGENISPGCVAFLICHCCITSATSFSFSSSLPLYNLTSMPRPLLLRSHH